MSTVQKAPRALPAPKRLGQAVGVVQRGHLLVADLRVHPDQLGVVELVDERERVPDRGQQDVAAGLVGLRLDREAHVVALAHGVRRHHVERLGVPVERGADVLGGTRLGALPAAPGDEDVRPELGGQVDVVERLAQGEAAYVAVVVGERAVPEDGVGDEVGGDHGHHQSGLLQRPAQGSEVLLLLAGVGPEGEHVVVVERDAVGTEVREPVHRVGGRHRLADRAAEDVDALPAHRPQAERELVLACGAEPCPVGHVLLLRGVRFRSMTQQRRPI